MLRSGVTLVLLAVLASPFRNTKTDQTLGVGRLHYSLSSTLSAHFRWNIGASERLVIELCSTEVLRSRPDYR